MSEVKNDPNKNAYTEAATDPYSIMQSDSGGAFSTKTPGGGASSLAPEEEATTTEEPSILEQMGKDPQSLIDSKAGIATNLIDSTGANGFDLDKLNEKVAAASEERAATRAQNDFTMGEDGEYGSLKIEDSSGLMTPEASLISPEASLISPEEDLFSTDSEDALMMADASGGSSTAGSASVEGGLDSLFSSGGESGTEVI